MCVDKSKEVVVCVCTYTLIVKRSISPLPHAEDGPPPQNQSGNKRLYVEKCREEEKERAGEIPRREREDCDA